MKMAVIFVNGLEKDPSSLVKIASSALLGVYGTFGRWRQFQCR